ncbi:MAG TPA: hypothetical protein VFR81_22370, partial [Longimicrobium sp.]|nr:hypothetical protein [Longimicrobium sp.]
PRPAPAPAEARLPAGWPALSPGAARPAEPGESSVRIVATVVPRGAAAGRYAIRYALRAEGPASDSVVVSVRERRALEAALEEAPRFAVAGAEYALAFRVANRGNVRARVRLEAESGRGFPARAEPSVVDLAPGESRPVRVVVSTRAAAGALAHLVTLRATSASDPSAAASAESRVAVVARSAGAADARHTLPVRVGLHARSGSATEGGLPAEISASGPLRAGGATRVDFLYRGAGAASAERGEEARLSLAVRGRRGELRLGDQYWSLSPLTAPGRLGSGAGGRIAAGAAWAEGFTERNRHLSRSPRVSAATIGIGGESASLSINGVAREGAASALSLRARARPAPGFGLDAEAARAGGAGAMHVHAYGALPGVSLDARALEADAAFPGEQRGRSLRAAHLAARPLADVRLHAAYEREARGDAPGSPLEMERRSSTHRAGASLGDLLTVEHRAATREGEGPRGSFARAARSWLASATLRAGGASLTGGGETGTVDDRISGRESPFGRVWGRIGGAWRGQSAWASVERTSGTSVETGAERDRVSGALGMALHPSAGTRVSLSAQAGRAAWAEEPDGMLDAAVEQRLPGGHTLRLRARAFPWADAGRRKPVVLLDYAVPLRVPVGRASDAGVISGRVVDVETDRPVADALVRVGDRAVLTDARGRWAVAGVAPGRYTVEIDPVSVGVGRVVVRPDALSVEVAGGGARAVEIGISRGARVHGAVLLPAVEGVEGGAGGVVLELRRDGERRRLVTDADGRFLFADLGPGRWTLAVVRADLPPHHALERESVEIEIAPGATEQVALRAVARRREMRIVAGGEVVLGAPAARGGAPALPPGRLPPGVAIAPKPAASRDAARPTPADSVAPTPAPRTAAAERPARRSVERPWRVRGESGFSDWANDSYVVQPGDESLTAIAWLAYRDGSLWPRIWLANRDILPTPDRMEPGMELIIPPFGPLTPEERAAARQHRARIDRRR